MYPGFSIYLELARIIATLMVFVAHSSIFYAPFNTAIEDHHFGRDGVIIFFVLSGFVISWCAKEKEPTLGSFALSRAARIYSVAVPAIGLGITVSLLQHWFTGQDLPYQFAKLWLYLPMYLSFTGNFWYLAETPPANFPYWSLDYEVWYYIVFGGYFFLKGYKRWLVVLIALALIGPNIIYLFPLWLAGSLLYFYRERIQIQRAMARILFFLSITAFVLAKYYALDDIADTYNEAVFRLFGIDKVPNQLMGDYLLGILVIMNFALAYQARFTFGHRASSLVRSLASYSFSFYLFHIPVFTLLSLVTQNRQGSLAIYFALLGCAATLIVLLARFTEHKKSQWKTFIGAAWALLVRPPRP